MLHARSDELKLALLALVSAAGGAADGSSWTCASLMDAATLGARIAPPQTVRDVGQAAGASTRVGAARIISTLCASCGACPRALTAEIQWDESQPYRR